MRRLREEPKNLGKYIGINGIRQGKWRQGSGMDLTTYLIEF